MHVNSDHWILWLHLDFEPLAHQDVPKLCQQKAEISCMWTLNTEFLGPTLIFEPLRMHLSLANKKQRSVLLSELFNLLHRAPSDHSADISQVYTNTSSQLFPVCVPMWASQIATQLPSQLYWHNWRGGGRNFSNWLCHYKNVWQHHTLQLPGKKGIWEGGRRVSLVWAISTSQRLCGFQARQAPTELHLHCHKQAVNTWNFLNWLVGRKERDGVSCFEDTHTIRALWQPCLVPGAARSRGGSQERPE